MEKTEKINKVLIGLLNEIYKTEFRERPRQKRGNPKCCKCGIVLGLGDRYAEDEHYRKYCIPCAKKLSKFQWVKNWD